VRDRGDHRAGARQRIPVGERDAVLVLRLAGVGMRVVDEDLDSLP
jgi:hypothetical protein